LSTPPDNAGPGFPGRAGRQRPSDPFRTYRPRLIVGLGIGAALALLVGAAAAAAERPLASLEWLGFGTALSLFCAAPWVVLRTGAVLVSVGLLLAGGVLSVFVPAYFAGGLEAPQVVWLLVIPLLCPLYFGSRATLIAGLLSLSAFAVLYGFEVSGRLPPPAVEPSEFSTFVNLSIAAVFVMVVSISTHRAIHRSHGSLLGLQRDLEVRSDALAESESRKSAIIDSAVTGLISADADDRIVECNPAACELLGYESDEVVGRTVSELMVPDGMRQAQAAAFHAALSRQATAVFSQPRELVALRKDGSQLPVEVTLQPVKGGGEAVFMAQLRDLSPQRDAEALARRREQQLQQAQKLEGVGRLAGGVAHDFNNLLTVIGGYSENIEGDPEASESVREQAGEITRAAERAATITRQMLAFSRGQNLDVGSADLRELLSNFESTIRSLVPAGIDLAFELADSAWPVRANETELERSLMNLVTNAVHAMPDGGRIEIATEYLEEESLRLHPSLDPGRFALLCVTDDGIGMTPEIRERAFEPFFTTKAIGEGTGLGLASVYGVVHQCGGHVELVSAPEQGTRVEIYLPISEEGQPRVVAVPEVPAPTLPTNFILLVDDESGIRNLVSRRLRREGYRVVEAADAQEALALIAPQADDLALVISDVVMPNGSGPGLAASLRKERPDLPVIFMSGFAGGDVPDLMQDFQGAVFLAKPLRMDSLMDVVGRFLKPAPLPDAGEPVESPR